jgi:hypothetical protein
MCPGRFPSPTPSRETSPAPSTEPNHSSGSPSPKTHIMDNFTAPQSFRKRPRFAESQSEPIAPQSGQSFPVSTSHHLTVDRRVVDVRRTSDPLRARKQPGVQKDLPVPRNQRDQQRASSSPLMQTLGADTSAPSTSPQTNSNIPNAQPPTPLLRTTSTPSPRIIDSKLREKLKESLNFSDTTGVLYVYGHPKQPDWGFKIGSTKRADYQTRLDEHRRHCGFVPRIVHVSGDISWCVRAEMLVGLDLADRRRHRECEMNSGLMHREWFQVSEELAKETVDRWERLMNEQSPYGWTKRLSPLWNWLMKTRTSQLSIHNSKAGHDARRRQWDTVLLPPTQPEILAFSTQVLLGILRDSYDLLVRAWTYGTTFFWQTLALAYGFVSFVAFRNTLASSAFALLLVCAYCSKIPDRKVGSPRKARSKSA